MRMLIAALGAAFVIAAPAPAPVAAAAVGGADGHDPATPSILAASAEVRGRDHLHDSPADDPESGAELLGQPAPPWTFTRWIGPPLSLEGLRGKVVLLRWWTEGCHFCAATLPELEALRRAHADDLVVIGVFHPKPSREVSNRRIVALAKRLGFSGRIAVDREWATLDRYWLAQRPERSWTSVSFLVDRKGLIRWVHGGGEYHRSDDPAHARCAMQYRDLERTLADVLAEAPSAGPTP